MKTFEVYPLFDVNPVSGKGAYVYDESGKEYLDFYGGHAVISIGHSHPKYVKRLEDQLKKLGFYSNSVHNTLQSQLAEKLGAISGYDDYSLFLVNSGAEAIENALKLSAFHNSRNKVIVFDKGFHGRTSLAVQATDNQRIQTSLDQNKRIIRLPLNDQERFLQSLDSEVSCVVVEGIQGVGGIRIPDDEFLLLLREKCTANGSLLILDEIQAGYGRSGKFFAHQHAGIKPDLITIAKGMGNGFPTGGVLISPEIKPFYGMLGTTFGGNHLACAAGLAVLEVIAEEKLIENAALMGSLLRDELSAIPEIKEIRGRGLMLAADFDFPIKTLRQKLVYDQGLFTGASSTPETLRLLPPLNITKDDIKIFTEKLKAGLQKI